MGHGARTSPSFSLWLDLQAALVDEVEGLDGVTPVDDARDVDLVRALADHLYVYVPFGKSGEHPAGDSDEVTHLFSNKREDGHVGMGGDLF